MKKGSLEAEIHQNNLTLSALHHVLMHGKTLVGYNKHHCAKEDCGKPSTLICARCRVVGYDTHECQVSDWAIHKRVCKYTILTRKYLSQVIETVTDTTDVKEALLHQHEGGPSHVCILAVHVLGSLLKKIQYASFVHAYIGDPVPTFQAIACMTTVCKLLRTVVAINTHLGFIEWTIQLHESDIQFLCIQRIPDDDENDGYPVTPAQETISCVQLLRDQKARGARGVLIHCENGRVGSHSLETIMKLVDKTECLAALLICDQLTMVSPESRVLIGMNETWGITDRFRMWGHYLPSSSTEPSKYKRYDCVVIRRANSILE